jgi:tetratricopeptide (TPR) repeat protein
LSLLASFLRRRFHGEVLRRDRIGPLLQKSDARGHDHARRVMQAYGTDWLKDEAILTGIMSLVGLFDRPASADCLTALRRAPAIEGLTDKLISLSSDQWSDAVSTLREVHLLDPEDVSSPDSLDAHPLVREWFGERLRQTNETAWKNAHSRLYEHLRDMTKEGDTPTLEDLAPLYQAVSHGCRAGRHQEALVAIYRDRICRRRPNGGIEYYARRQLGAVGSDLAAISSFFDRPYAAPTVELTPDAQSWVLSEVASLLLAQGRFAEALVALRTALQMDETAKDWRSAAVDANNIAEGELVLGEIAMAIQSASLSVKYADIGGHQFDMEDHRALQGAMLHAAGQFSDAQSLFSDAEQRQKSRQPYSALLYSMAGYRYSDLLLSRGQFASARDRATQNLARLRDRYPLLNTALDTLTIGRANLALALVEKRASPSLMLNVVAIRDQFDRSIDVLRAAAQNDELARGPIARAAFCRSVGHWDGAASDLAEVEEIAELGPMKLYLCDVALERARLTFARIEAFAPLNGMLEADNPPKAVVPSAEEISKLKREAEKQLKIAADYIEICGYHRRDEELAELQAVLRGEKKFADLPPRV